MSGNSKFKVPFQYFGGKVTHLDSLYNLFPKNVDHFVDLFGGSFVVGLNYPYKSVITINELNSDIVNFFLQLRDNKEKFIEAIMLTPFSMEEYQLCWQPAEDLLERARRFYVRTKQSFYGQGANIQGKGWMFSKSSKNVSRGEGVSRWANAENSLLEIAAAIRNNIQVTNLDWSECIDRTDSSNTFFYVDPPYPKETRKSFNDYRFEFSTEDHINLANKLHSIKGKVAISSYDSELYNTLYADWIKVELPVKQNNIRKGTVQEIVWLNYHSQYEKTLFD